MRTIIKAHQTKKATKTAHHTRAALEKIRKIVEELGPDSYIATAFDGCFKDAEANIENDFADSMKERYEQSREDAAHFKAAADSFSAELDKLRGEHASLKSRLLADDDLADISRLLSKTVADLGKEVSDAAARIVEVADQPESAAFRNAVKDHRAAKADLSHWTELLTRVNNTKNRA